MRAPGVVRPTSRQTSLTPTRCSSGPPRRTTSACSPQRQISGPSRAPAMRVVAHDPFISSDVAAGIGVELVSLDDLCAAADYVTLHLPSTEETTHLFNEARFGRCRPGIRIINTARGDLIDEQALRRAIE